MRVRRRLSSWLLSPFHWLDSQSVGVKIALVAIGFYSAMYLLLSAAGSWELARKDVGQSIVWQPAGTYSDFGEFLFAPLLAIDRSLIHPSVSRESEAGKVLEKEIRSRHHDEQFDRSER